MSAANALIQRGLDASKPGSGFIAGRLYFASDTSKLYYDSGSAWVDSGLGAGGGGGGGNIPQNSYVCLADRKASGTGGGNSSATTWQTRVLNTTVADTGTLSTLASNQVTLSAGTYLCEMRAPCVSVGAHKVRLRNVTGSTTLVVGDSAFEEVSSAQSGTAVGSGTFTVAASQALEVQHWTATAVGSSVGLGEPTTSGEQEQYTVVEFWKLS